METIFSYSFKSIFGIIILSSCSIFNATSQNLVPNSSFEIKDSCPIYSAQLFLAVPWVSPTKGTPDYFNSCADSMASIDIPSNAPGFQYAKTGNAYVGFYTLNLMFPNGREFIQVQLNDTLKMNQVYNVQFFVSLANQMQYATSSIGVYFSQTAVSVNSSYLLPYSPQIINPSSNPLTDTLGWTLISGTFKAQGNEQYLTIGNFNTDTKSDTTFVGGNGWGKGASYYYIDDISVIEEDTTSHDISSSIETPLPNIFTPNNDGVNDIFKIKSENLSTFNLKIYNRWGVLIKELKAANEEWDGRTTAGMECSNGMYYFLLTAKGMDDKQYIEKGFIQLIR